MRPWSLGAKAADCCIQVVSYWRQSERLRHLRHCAPIDLLHYYCIVQGLVETCLSCNLWVIGIVNYRALPKVQDSFEALLEWKLVIAINLANFIRTVLILALPMGRVELPYGRRLIGLRLRGGGMYQGSAVSFVLCLGNALAAASLHWAGAAPGEEGQEHVELWPAVLVFSLAASVNLLFSAVWLLSLCVERQALNRAPLPLHDVLAARGRRGPPEPVDVAFGLLKSTGEDGFVCVICMEDLSLGCEVGRLECNHVFHAGCIRAWVQQAARRAAACPLRCFAPAEPRAMSVAL